MKKVLIANRGEIAVRIIRACHDLGLQTVAVYSKADAQALHVLQADEAICIGDSPAQASYLKIPNILAACEITGADAVHPGYGFLSENSNFANICERCGLLFIGPTSQAIAKLGDKAEAKATAKRAGCPVIPGSEGVVETVEEGLQIANEMAYPVLIKAVAGGGGKGIRIACSKEEFAKQFATAQAEATANFGNSAVYIEKMILSPRHIEFQVVGDQKGQYIHLGERDCTMQRRRQKLIEEAPSPALTPDLREKMGQAAIGVVREAEYHSVATVEFLLDQKKNFYFMEVNTRIQVEHTVTEELTGVDLIKEQIKVAMGESLSHTQDQIRFNGHVIQFRVNAENPEKHFMPTPGKLEYYMAPGGPHVRVDSACYAGYQIPPNYDSMIAKLIVRGKSREEAVAIGKRALREFHIGGVSSTIPYHLYMLEDPHFLSGMFDLHYTDQLIADGCQFKPR